MFNYIGFVLMIVVVSYSSVSAAQCSPSYRDTSKGGAYADLNAGLSVPTPASETKLVGIGLNLNIGYQFNQYVGLEVGATDCLIFPARAFLNIDSAFKGILPVNDRFSVFGKIGVAYAIIDGSDDFFESSRIVHQWSLYSGIGAAFKVTPRLEVAIQAATIPKNDAFVSLGFIYHW